MAKIAPPGLIQHIRIWGNSIAGGMFHSGRAYE
jgi:hypothetical protein